MPAIHTRGLGGYARYTHPGYGGYACYTHPGYGGGMPAIHTLGMVGVYTTRVYYTLPGTPWYTSVSPAVPVTAHGETERGMTGLWAQSRD